jgi:ubiquinone/menaquinone biosynthesis C-methylase UbiE
MNSVTEAERQVLIALIELTDPIETPNNTYYAFYPKSLEDAAAYFRSLRQDWTPAYVSLLGRGLLRTVDSGYALTSAGAELARQERLEHPPIWYWYREYYTITTRSSAYSRFCEALYGCDWCQTSFSDMAQIRFLIQAANLVPGSRVLDLGCGKGLFAEFLSDTTGARVSGVDYVPEAIQQALQRTAAKRDRLDFTLGNFDHLDYLAGSFESVMAIDTLYMPNDLPATLRKLRDLLTPGGKMLVFYSTFCSDAAQSRETLLPDNTGLARALGQVGLSYRTWDFTEPTFRLMRRKYQLAESMRGEFEAEGTMFLYDHLIAESDKGEGPYDPRTVSMARYLYQVPAAGGIGPQSAERPGAGGSPWSPGA